jgi:2-amino-4-hydroxy-6-hydroxymethyldihydropteridine diphosphokinase
VIKNIAYIGLGSNIEQPYQQIKNAIIALDKIPDTKVRRDSGYYKSRPMGPEDQPDYVNAVVELETILTPAELLEHCQRIEQQQGRVRLRRWGERSIDLDILLYAGNINR